MRMLKEEQGFEVILRSFREQIGRGIESFRKKLGLSRGDFYKSIELSNSMASSLERGLRFPSFSTLTRICYKYRLPLDVLFQLIIPKEANQDKANRDEENREEALFELFTSILNRCLKETKEIIRVALRGINRKISKL